MFMGLVWNMNMFYKKSIVFNQYSDFKLKFLLQNSYLYYVKQYFKLQTWKRKENTFYFKYTKIQVQ